MPKPIPCVQGEYPGPMAPLLLEDRPYAREDFERLRHTRDRSSEVDLMLTQGTHDEECWAFIIACNEAQRRLGNRFLPWSVIYQVVKTLGYQKIPCGEEK